MGGSVVISLSLLSLGPERKVKCYNMYFVNGYVFHTEEYGHGRKTYNNGVCIKGSTSSEFEVDYYDRLEEVIVAMLRSHKKKSRKASFPDFCISFSIRPASNKMRKKERPSHS
jgi:hypothetical protein